MKSSIHFKQDYFGDALMLFFRLAVMHNYTVKTYFYCTARHSFKNV